MNATICRLGKLGAAWLVAGAVAMAAAGSAQAQASATDAASKALSWVKTQQQPDGSYAGFGAGSTVDALLAIIASKQDLNAFPGGSTALNFLTSKAADLAKTPGGAGKLLLAVAALGESGAQFGGVNLIA